MRDKLKNEKLFDLGNFKHQELFESVSFPWEVVGTLESYVSKLLTASKNEVGGKIIGEGTVIDPSANIVGHAVIGSGCTISDGVLLRGSCVIGDNVHVGHGVEIKNSVLMNNTSVAHLNYLGDSIVGNGVNIGGGVIVANWRLDKKSVTVAIDNEKIDTGLEKFGVAIGDNCSIGVNSALNPGTILGRNTIVYPLTSVTGFHPDNSSVKKSNS